MKRRYFLRNTASGVLLPYLLNGFSLKAMAGTPLMQAINRGNYNDNILVLIQLSGGNDGLNTVIPISDYKKYLSARNTISIPENKTVSLKGIDNIGIHPAMEAIVPLLNEERVGIIQAVSYPNPSFSHFRAADIWLTGSDADKIINTGWAGRYLDTIFPEFPQHYPNEIMPDPLAIQIGSVLSGSLQGPTYSMGLALNDPTNFYNLLDSPSDSDLHTRRGEQLDYLKSVSVKTDQYGNVIKRAALKVTKQSDKYPAGGSNQLADQLKIVARLIAGGLRTKIYVVGMGGFDLHANQVDKTDATKGAHAIQLKKVSDAISAFMTDLDYLKVGDRVMGVTFSEFGRRIISNASGGTDHGTAAPVFYFGNKVQGKMVGTNPLLPEKASVNDNIPMQHDFRSLYATLLQKWLNLNEQDTQRVLNGKFDILPIV